MKPLPFTVVRTATDLFALWEGLMGGRGFATSSVWIAFLDADHRVQPVLVPVDDIPAEPHPRFVRNLTRIVADLVDTGTAASAALLLSRPGPPAMSEADRRWARALADALGPELAVWPLHLATSGRIQVFAPDDLIAA